MTQTDLEPSRAARARSAFRSDARARRLRGAAEAILWSAAAVAGRAVVKPQPKAGRSEPLKSPPPPAGALRRAWVDAFAKDARDVAAGLYVTPDGAAPNPMRLWRRLNDLFDDGREVEARRHRGGGVEVRHEAQDLSAFPPYYRQNFHFQTGGWLTEDSAQRYETQVEALFAGTAGPMRRRALALLATALRGEDQRDLAIVDVACGSGAFLGDVAATFPRAALIGVDLSAAYVAEARKRSGAEPVQANAERLPFADASLDALTCVYLFHELPPKVRIAVAAEFARVLKPGGVAAFADSIQASDAPELARPLESFPLNFHEPFYESYQATDLNALFEAAGLTVEARDTAFFTKALLLRKPA